MKLFGLDLEALAWKRTRVEGVDLVLLHPSEEEAQRAREERGTAVEGALLIRMQPGCGYPPHRHLGVEEVLVLQGGYRDHLGEHRAGSYVRYEAGSEHAPRALGADASRASPRGVPCILFASARAGIELLR